MMLESKLFSRENEKGLKTILLDSLIVALFVVFSTLSDTPSMINIWVAIKAGGLAFFAQLAFEKGIKRKWPLR